MRYCFTGPRRLLGLALVCLMHSILSRFPTFAVVTFSLAACTAGRPGPAPVAPGGTEVDAIPVTSVLDSARLTHALQAVAPPPGDSATGSLFVIHFAGAGTIDSVRSLNLGRRAPSNASVLQQIIANHVRPQPARDTAWTFPLEMSGGSGRPVEVRKVTEQAPRLINASRLVTEIEQVVEQVKKSNPGYRRGSREVLVSGVVTREGKMEAVSLVRGCGDGWIDQEALRLARVARFRPATIADIPVPVLVHFPISFDF